MVGTAVATPIAPTHTALCVSSHTWYSTATVAT